MEDRVTTWLEFKEQIELRFASETQRAYWWDELEGLGQGNQLDSAGVIHRLQDLFGRLTIDSDQQRVRYLLKALSPQTAYQLEQLCRGKPRSWTEAVDAVTTAESMRPRYGSQPGNVSHTFTPQDSLFGSTFAPSNASKAALSDLAKQFAELKVHLVGLTSQSKPRDPARQAPKHMGPRQFTGNCYRCDEPGHRASEYLQAPSSGNGLEQQ